MSFHCCPTDETLRKPWLILDMANLWPFWGPRCCAVATLSTQRSYLRWVLLRERGTATLCSTGLSVYKNTLLPCCCLNVTTRAHFTLTFLCETFLSFPSLTASSKGAMPAWGMWSVPSKRLKHKWDSSMRLSEYFILFSRVQMFSCAQCTVYAIMTLLALAYIPLSL